MSTIALDNRGGGWAAPPYMQGRGSTGAPMITPKSSVVPGEVKKPALPQVNASAAVNKMSPAMGGPNGVFAQATRKLGIAKPAAKPTITPGPGGAPGALPTGAQTLYEFFKGDLASQRTSMMADRDADLARRGVHYSNVGDEAGRGIDEQYNRGLGQLQAGMIQDERQNEIQRLQLATQLAMGMPQAQGGGMDPAVFQQIGALLTPRGGPTAPNMTPGPAGPAPTAPKAMPTSYNQVRR